jgi:hypothetical protein
MVVEVVGTSSMVGEGVAASLLMEVVVVVETLK